MMFILLYFNGRSAAKRLDSRLWLIDALEIADLLESLGKCVVVPLYGALNPLFNFICT